MVVDFPKGDTLEVGEVVGSTPWQSSENVLRVVSFLIRSIYNYRIYVMIYTLYIQVN